MNYTDLINEIKCSADANHIEQIYRDNINNNGYSEWQKQQVKEAYNNSIGATYGLISGNN